MRATPIRQSISDEELAQATAAIAKARVGGDYWGLQPVLPPVPYTLIRSRKEQLRLSLLNKLPHDRTLVCWTDKNGDAPVLDGLQINYVSGCCDPWHLTSGATEVFADPDDELVAIATLSGIPVHGLEANSMSERRFDPRALIRDQLVGPFTYANPFTGEAMSLSEAVELCTSWRRLIDGNRPVSAAVGFAPWKRATVAPLLWGGSTVNFTTRPRNFTIGGQIFAWKSRIPPALLIALEHDGADLIEVEDGFIRSVGLGADCVPPLSLVVDHLGAYFDPKVPSELETMLQTASFPIEITERARRIRELIVAEAVSKYGTGWQPIERRATGRRHLLVPGQVEDDRSVQCGGGEVSNNLELLRRVRADSPTAYIIYKPHPDVEAGHRVGAVSEAEVAQFADEVVRSQPITSLLEMVDEVHVNTSLAGFEALLRNKPVTTHGVPFYAGWGLTRDLGEVPARRTTRRTLDELVAATLLLYPRYLDPVTKLPCTPEILLRRLVEGTDNVSAGPLVALRRLQGHMRRRLASLRSW